MVGRPSDFTQATADVICARLAGGESLRGICQDEHMPGKSTVFQWLLAHPEFADQYARAREVQADHLADEILEISDDGSNDWMKRTGKDQTDAWVVNGEHVQRSRLRVDSRKWFASKVAPKKYGERVTQEHTGPDGGPISTKATLDVSGLSTDQLKALASIKVE